jgi:two-component system response regulator (stage 0 sporulation protein A)
MIVYSMTKRLYPEVAQAFGVTPAKVELAIRHTIEVMWDRGTLRRSEEILGLHGSSMMQKPTNGEFVALLADRLSSFRDG